MTEPTFIPVIADDELDIPPASEFVSSLFNYIEPEIASDGLSLTYVEVMTVDLPIELDLQVKDGKQVVAASAPTQRTRTSIYPVLHKIRLTMKADSL